MSSVSGALDATAALDDEILDADVARHFNASINFVQIRSNRLYVFQRWYRIQQTVVVPIPHLVVPDDFVYELVLDARDRIMETMISIIVLGVPHASDTLHGFQALRYAFFIERTLEICNSNEAANEIASLKTNRQCP
jgi:hypothetical protein